MAKYKIIFIIAIVTLVSLVFWFSAKPWIDSPIKFADWHVWIWPLIMMIVMGAICSVAYILLPKKRLQLLTSAIIGFAYLAVFGFYYLDIIAVLIILLLHLYAIYQIKLELNDRIRIHIGQIMRRGIGGIMIPIYIALSFGYFSSPSIQARATLGLSPSFKQAVVSVMDKFLESEYDYIPAAQKEQVSSYAVQEVYDYFMSFIEPYQKYVPPFLAFGLFIILISLGFIIDRLCVWCGKTIFWILRIFGFVRVEEVDVKAQRLTL